MTISALGGAARQTHVAAQVCIIGGGLAGLTIAHRLLGTAKRVIVLESGAAAQDLNEVEAPRAYASASHRQRGLGGSSARWGGRFLPLTRYETGARDHVSLPGWPIDVLDLERYRGTVERLFTLPPGSYEDSARADLPRGEESPVPDEDFDVRFPKWAPVKRRHLGATLEPILRAASNVTVYTDATVTAMVTDPDTGCLIRVVARDGSGGQLSVSADEFVLACGTIETTRILLALDRQEHGRLTAGGVPLGRYLQDHLGLKVAVLDVVDHVAANRMFGYRFQGAARRNVHLELSPTAQARDRVGAGFAQVIMTPDARSSTYVVKKLLRSRQSGGQGLTRADLRSLARESPSLARGAKWRLVDHQHYWPRALTHGLFVWIEQLPHERNRITLAESVDRLGVRRARVDWTPVADSEEATFRAILAALRRYWVRQRLDRLSRLQWSNTAVDDVAPITPSATEVLHPLGTTRMGTDPRTSVVDPELRCHRIPNLRIASASVYPTSGSTGPTYTLLLLAARVGEQLAR